MARPAPKSVRFSQVVARSGVPHAHTLWVAPKDDRELQQAIAAGRVMTIEAAGASGKTSVGVVGFDARGKRNDQILIFPKSLKAFAGARVIGIKFELLEQPAFAAPAELRNSAMPRRRPATARKSASRSAPPDAPAAPKMPTTPAKAAAQSQSSGETSTPPQEAPAAANRPVAPAKSRTATHRPPRLPDDHALAALVREIRSAMKELEGGKSVAAYQRLERAIAHR